jgi:hypothetical protein
MTVPAIPTAINNIEGFPWGSNNPSRRQRIIVALLIALIAGGSLFFHDIRFGGDIHDFSQALFGARALMHGADPYVLVGRGRVFESRWPVMYPATAFAAAIPLTLFTDGVASVVFVAISAFLLAYGSTRSSWHRLPMFASVAFISSVQMAQWSILMTAIFFIPQLAAFVAVKPQSALPILIASPTRGRISFSLVGAVLLLAVSLLLYPGWLEEWWAIIRHGEQFSPPLLRQGGFLLLLTLLRWRRPEARFVLFMACMPQSWAWYNALSLLAIPATYREACVLSLLSSVGGLGASYFIRDSSPASYAAWGAALVAFAYLPATIAVLRRPNVRARAPWDRRAVPQRDAFR